MWYFRNQINKNKSIGFQNMEEESEVKQKHTMLVYALKPWDRLRSTCPN